MMTPNEAAKLLGIAAAFDNRKPDPDTAAAWAAALSGLRFEDCRAAIVEHYSNVTDWIMPAHVRAIVKRTRASRIEDAPPIAIPDGFDPDDTEAYIRLLVEAKRAQAEGREVVQPMQPPPLAIESRLKELRVAAKVPPRVVVRPHERSAEFVAEVAKASAELEPLRQAHRLAMPKPSAEEGDDA